ncbi:quinon protein alcohol dehydrogenase-like superfamily, partial [Tricladium varicosporioides]
MLKDSEGDYAIAMSSDGKYLAGGSRLVEVFLAETGLRLWTLEIPSGDDDEIHTAAFNKSATQLAAGGEKGIIYVWDLKSGQLVETLTGHTAAIFSIEYTPDGSHIVSGSEDKTVRVWDSHSLRSR